jgi:sugar lactone lactonase YvrE
MKARISVLKSLRLAVGVLICCAPNLPAQTPPAITTQPASQTNLPGTNVTFTVAVSGTGPFTYQWQFNGTNLPNGIISTVAGNGTGTYAGDGGAATSASLHYPTGVALDVVGNLYIADQVNQRIRKVNPNGTISTVAGTGNSGYSGDGGAAGNAGLSAPFGVTLDAVNNLYIGDQCNNRIRVIGTNGIISTVAGNGTGAPSSGAFSGDGAAATNASLFYPQGVVLDYSGNLYIADQKNCRIRKVDTNGIITTVAGTNSAGYSGDGGAATAANLWNPTGVALDTAGNLYIADATNNRIRKVDTNAIITTVAGNAGRGYSGDGGASISASLYSPSGMVVDGLGNLYIADAGNNRVRKVGTNGIITTVAGTNSPGYSGDGGAATNARLYYPIGVALDASGNLYIADKNNNRIREVLLYATYPTLTLNDVGAGNAGNYTVVITGPYGGVTSAVATLTVQAPPVVTAQPVSQIAFVGSNSLFSVGVAGSGPFGYLWYFDGTNLVQSDSISTLALADVSTNDVGSYAVVVTNDYGSVTSLVATLAVVTAQPGSKTVLAATTASLGVTVYGTGPFTYQWQFNGTNLPNNIISTVAGNGTAAYGGDGGAAIKASLDGIGGVALDAVGELFIADTSNDRIRKVDTNGVITTVAGNGTNGYSGDGGPAINAMVNLPIGANLDAFGNLYIADTYNVRIRKVDTNGVITTVAGNGTATFAGDGGAATNASLNRPTGVGLDASGNLYIADCWNGRVRKVDTNGIVTTVAGTGTGTYAGDGGAATNASLNGPSGVAFDASGNLYIADFWNNRIRKVDTNGIITTIAGNGVGNLLSDEFSGDGGAATNAQLGGPYSVAVDAFGDVYIADSNNDRIRKVDTNGIITTVAGGGAGGDGGAATNAIIYSPYGVALDAAGNLYIADYGHNRIREVLLYASYPTLTLSSVSASNAGSYTVVVTSPYCSVTSAVAALNVAMAPPQIIACDASFGFVTNQFGFNLSGPSGQTIVVDGSADLVNWTPLCTNTVGSGPLYFFDPCWTNFGWRFYRARLP